MADVIFYSTGEIFWVSDSPPGKPHIGVPQVLPALPPDHLFTYALAAHVLEDAGHTVIGAFGRQRAAVRNANGEGQPGGPDPEILALGELPHPERTVLVLIATDSGKRPRGSDDFERIPFTPEEREAVAAFRREGGGIYVTWDHGQLGYESLRELGLHEPIDPEPEEPLRPNVHFSNDTTDEARVLTPGLRRRKGGTAEPADVWLSVGPPAGYLQKIVPAQVLYKDSADPTVPRPVTPHPIFNGVGGSDGIWIPAHMHEGKLKGRATLQGIDETLLPPGVKYLAVHVPFTETTFFSYAVMAYRDSLWRPSGNGQQPSLQEGRVIWDTSFHHVVDINWVSDGKVPWDPFVPFSAQALWKQQLPPDLFEARLERGMKRLFANAVRWLAHQLPGSPVQQRQSSQMRGVARRTAYAFAGAADVESGAPWLDEHESGYPPLEYLNH